MNDVSTGGGPLGFLNPNNESAKGWFSWIALGGAAIAIWYWILPIVIATLVGTLQAFALGSIALLFVTAVFHKRFRFAVGFLVQRFFDLLASGVVNRDPIGIMKYYLREVESNIATLSESLSDLRGALEKANTDLGEAQEKMDKNDGIVLAASKSGNATSPGAIAAASIAERSRGVVARIQGEITQGTAAIAILKIYLAKAAGYRLDLVDNIETTEKQRERVKTSFRAFKAAARILKGQSTGAEMYAEARNANSQQMAAMVGEMKQFVSESRGIVEGFTLERDGAVEQVLARLKQREETSLLLEHQPQVPSPLSTAQPNSAIAIGDFLKS